MGNYNKATYKKFRCVLKKANLQCPTSSWNKTYSRKAGDFEGFATEYFYYDKGSLVFEMSKKSHRSELRFLKQWKITDKKYHTFRAIVKPISKGSDKFTFIQIHGVKDKINKPVLRICLNYGKIRAIVFDGEKYVKSTLAIYGSEKFLNFKVVAGNGHLSIYLNKEKVLHLNVDYPSECYYKCGVYLQDNESAQAIFDKIKGNF